MFATTAVRSRDSLVLFRRVFAGALAANLAYVEILNDHFDRISRGHQILAFGAIPFRDFFDPGWLLMIYTSAAAQAIFGHRLLGEVILSGVFTAGGIALAAVLVHAACNSRRAALAAALLLVLAQPRAYDYDKVFFYAFGLFMCWSYADLPTRRAAVALAFTTVVAGLYRYDNGVYIAAAALVTMLTVHWPDVRLVGRRVTLFAMACLAASAPAALFIATHGGIPDAARQVVAYARVEYDRTRLRGRPRPAIDWNAPLLVVEPPAPSASVLGRTRVLPGWLTRGNAEAFLYFLLVSLPVLAIVGLLWKTPVGTSMDRQVAARGLAAAALCGLACVFVLRDPVRARYAAVAVPGVVLAAWLLRDASGPLRGARRRARAAGMITVGGTAALAMVMLSAWVERLEPLLTVDDEEPRAARLLRERTEQWSWVIRSAPDKEWMYGYIARCTGPDDRVMVVDFQPQVPFFTGRGFAGGMLVFFGDHWSSAADQQRIVQRLQSESVPMVISRGADPLGRWPTVLDYVRQEYMPVGQSAFGRNPDEQFSVFLKRDIDRGMSRDIEWDLPCVTL